MVFVDWTKEISLHIHDYDNAGDSDGNDGEDLNQGDIGHHFLVNKAAKSGVVGRSLAANQSGQVTS